MFKFIADNQRPNSMASKLRRKRTAFFESLITPLQKPVRLLDIGGTEMFWKVTGLSDNEPLLITLLNLDSPPVSGANFVSVAGDARHLNFGAGSFEVVFSNSVIEHVGSHQDQLLMAQEVRRVGKRYFIQTPNKYFPIEPHFLFPFFQFLPFEMRVWLVRNFKMGWFPKTPDKVAAEGIVAGITLLDKRQFASLFPDARIYEEKIFGMTKSFVAYSGWGE